MFLTVTLTQKGHKNCVPFKNNIDEINWVVSSFWLTLALHNHCRQHQMF